MSEKPRINPLLIVVPILAIIAVIAVIEMSGKSNGQDPEKPASINAQQAEAAVRQAIPNVKVDSVSPSPIDGIWEMVVDTPQGKRIAYIDVEGKYLIGGSLLELATGTDLTRKKTDALNKIDFASIPLDDAVVLGNPDAAIKVVVFDDPD